MTLTSTPPAPPPAPSPAEALRFWLRLGCISFGGPAGQIALMHEELVVRRRWISEQRFLHALNYCIVLPGPEAQQLATYIGWLMHRTWGGIVAGGLFVLPSLLLLIALSWVYLAFGHVPVIAGLFHGIKPAVTALVVHAAWRVGSRTLKNGWLWVIAAGAFVALFALRLPFPLIVLAAGLVGWLGGRLAPAEFQAGGGHGAARSGDGPAVIDDHTPTPDHALFLAGAAAATVVTFFTFLPSFCFILLGGPFIETAHGNLRFTAPLTGITAAVVGVILNLALFFAVHVLWPRGMGGPFDFGAAAIGLAAGLALFRWKLGVIPVVLGSGVAGLLLQLAGAVPAAG